ncbi:MAG: ATP-dependent helicase [Sphingomonadales bacterium]
MMSDGFDLDFIPEQAPPPEPAATPYLDALNPAQREAVEALDGPVLVLAGAGTGKTRVLTTRLAHLLAAGRCRPWEVLAVTFTNKAAREMHERVGAVIGPPAEDVNWLGTFHAIGSRILRRHAELVGLKSDFTILGTDDQLRLLKQLISAANIDEKRWPAKALAHVIDGWKNRGLTPDQLQDADGHAYADGRGKALYTAYQGRLRTLNAVDFGDLLLHGLTLLQNNTDILRQYQSRFRYILVDEYQDTNVVQYLWLRLLAQSHKNICCVGDDDQSIYGWRGAEVGNILRFETDFPGAHVVRLEQNYRSTPHILGAASGLIAANQGRLGKTLFTDIEHGEKVVVRGVWDGEQEARAVGEEMENLRRKDTAYKQMAVLVRAGFQTREFEDLLLTLGIPYQVIGGARFYERLEIRDAVAYLNIIAQPAHDLAFERIMNKPRRGLGDATLAVLQSTARARRIPLLQAAEIVIENQELRAQAHNKLKRLIEDLARWRELSGEIPLTELTTLVLDESGYKEMWRNDKSPDSPGRLDNLSELIRAMETFECLADFLEHVSLVMDVDDIHDDDKVSLMTLHAAKGLEFDAVFLPGWEEGLFPHNRALDEGGTKALEEERRLAYVGITRARKRAFITFAASRRIYGQWQSAIPSRFIAELPDEHVERVADQGLHSGGRGGSDFDDFSSFDRQPSWKTKSTGQGQKSGVQTSEWRNEAPTKPRTRLIKKKSPPMRPKKKPTARFKVGERIFHQKFGYGTISAIDGNKLDIDFEKSDTKRLMGSFVERVEPSADAEKQD